MSETPPPRFRAEQTIAAFVESESADFDEVLVKHSDIADGQRTAFEHWIGVTGVLEALGTLQDRLQRSYGPDVDPEVTLDEPDSGSRFLDHLTASSRARKAEVTRGAWERSSGVGQGLAS